MINIDCQMLFPRAYISHPTALNSDHRLLLLNTNLDTIPIWKPFRFETMWTWDSNVATVIANAWNRNSVGNPLYKLTNKLKTTRLALKSWNKLSLGHVQTQIKQLTSHIEILQNLPPMPHNLTQEASAQLNLDEMLKQEELYQRDKSKENWMAEGGANTGYFHLSTTIQHRFNGIEYVKKYDGTVEHDRSLIRNIFIDYFLKIVYINQSCVPNHFNDLIQPSINVVENSFLCSIPDRAEVRGALISMGSHKCPGHDGFNPLFFKTYQNIVQSSIVEGVQYFFNHGNLAQAMNHTYIALIPKVEGATKVEQFCLIALCNVGLKIIANKLRAILDKVVAPTQSAFVPNQNIQDNTILNHEIMHFMNERKGKLGFMALKIEMAKAYDKMDQGILGKIQQLYGVASHFSNLIHECISSATYSILLNGSPTRMFAATLASALHSHI